MELIKMGDYYYIRKKTALLYYEYLSSNSKRIHWWSKEYKDLYCQFKTLEQAENRFKEIDDNSLKIIKSTSGIIDKVYNKIKEWMVG